jgi:hypothetical protein
MTHTLAKLACRFGMAALPSVTEHSWQWTKFAHSKPIPLRRIWDSQGRDYGSYCLQEYDTVQFVRNVSKFQRNLLLHYRVATFSEMSINCYHILWLHTLEIRDLTVLLISIIYNLVIYVHVYQMQSSGTRSVCPYRSHICYRHHKF